jgi:hypothetical protein
MAQTLKQAYRKNATWLCNKTTVGAIRKLRDVDGRPLWQPSTQAGRPAEPSLGRAPPPAKGCGAFRSPAPISSRFARRRVIESG